MARTFNDQNIDTRKGTSIAVDERNLTAENENVTPENPMPLVPEVPHEETVDNANSIRLAYISDPAQN